MATLADMTALIGTVVTDAQRVSAAATAAVTRLGENHEPDVQADFDALTAAATELANAATALETALAPAPAP